MNLKKLHQATDISIDWVSNLVSGQFLNGTSAQYSLYSATQITSHRKIEYLNHTIGKNTAKIQK